jgi:peptide deformylase
MSILKVARMGHPILRARARPVGRTIMTDPAFQKLVDDMLETMREYHGIGLAGPQIHEGLRLFVAGVEDAVEADGGLPLLAAINPEVIPIGGETEEDWEGCLSIPDIRGMTPRPRRVVLKALDRRGKGFERELSGFPARVVQHETDHLDGVLFLDRMTSLGSLTFLDEYSRYWTKDRD